MSPTQKNNVSIGKISLQSGLIITVCLIIYFMIMRYFQLTDSALAWSFNFVLLFSGISLTYRYYRLKTNPNVEYFSGMLLGTAITSVSVIVFTLFIYLYFSTLTSDQLLLLQDNILFMGGTLSPLKIAAATFVEGFSSGIVIGFIIMQYYKSGFRNPKVSKSTQS